MKELSLLIWLTQLGLSVAFPLAGFLVLAVWLRDTLGWGNWVIWVGLIVGLICAFTGFRDSLKIMTRLTADKKQEPPGTAYNEHK